MTRTTQRLSLLSAGVLICSSLAGTAIADPTGTTYQLQVENFFEDDGPVDVVFDANTQVVGGLEVMEMATPLTNGFELIEIWFDKEEAPISSNLSEPVRVVISGLHWLDDAGNKVPGRIVPGSVFAYLTIDGVPLDLDDTFPPHPVNPDIRVLPLDEVFINPDFQEDIALETVISPFGGLGALADVVNDAHLGFQVEHIPEPGTLALAMMAAGFFAVGRRRAR